MLQRLYLKSIIFLCWLGNTVYSIMLYLNCVELSIMLLGFIERRFWMVEGIHYELFIYETARFSRYFRNNLSIYVLFCHGT